MGINVFGQSYSVLRRVIGSTVESKETFVHIYLYVQDYLLLACILAIL